MIYRMKLIKKFYPLILFIGIIFIGVIRWWQISSYEISRGTPTMSGSFAFIAYFIIAVIVLIVSLLILWITSIKESILNKTIKQIFIITLLIVFIPIIGGILFVFH